MTPARWLAALLLLGGCSSPEERACARAAEPYAKERAAGRAPEIGWSTDAESAVIYRKSSEPFRFERLEMFENVGKRFFNGNHCQPLK